ncbi:MAG: hypothetical protein R3F11_01420 [Verrucomicrobiales bacterium]
MKTNMKHHTQAFALFACLTLLQSRLAALPAVSEDYSQMAAGVHSGKRLNEIIKPEDVSSICLIENRGKGSPIAQGFRPQWKSDELLQSAFTNTLGAKDCGFLSATEGSYARYALITKKGELFLLEVVCDQMKGRSDRFAFAWSRIWLPNQLAAKTTTEQDGGGQPATRPESK